MNVNGCLAIKDSSVMKRFFYRTIEIKKLPYNPPNGPMPIFNNSIKAFIFYLQLKKAKEIRKQRDREGSASLIIV